MAFACREAVKPDVKTNVFDKIKTVEQVNAYRGSGTSQVTLEAVKPLGGKYFKMRG